MERKKISSECNPSFKRWKKLHTRKGRAEYQSFLVEGRTLINEAHFSGLKLQEIIFCSNQTDDFLEAKISGVPLYELNQPLFSQIVQTHTPQGVVAVVTIPSSNLEEMLSNNTMFFNLLLLDGVQDPGNLGALIRTGDAMGIGGIVLGSGTVDEFNPKVVRSAMGSLFRLPIIRGDLKQVIPILKEKKITIIGTSPRAKKDIFHFVFPKMTAFLLGNEGRGVHPIFNEYIDDEVNVPMPGSTESLNVSVTGAIVLYEQIRQHVSMLSEEGL